MYCLNAALGLASLINLALPLFTSLLYLSQLNLFFLSLIYNFYLNCILLPLKILFKEVVIKYVYMMHFIPIISYFNKFMLFLRCIGYQNCRVVYRLNKQAIKHHDKSNNTTVLF